MVENNKEIWKDVPNYEGFYQVSDWGRVKSLDRMVIDSRGGKRLYKSKIIGTEHKGYMVVGLSNNCISKTLKVSQLVAMAFLGHKPDGHRLVIDHINGNKLDDRLSNLRIVTQRENVSTCFRFDKKLFKSKYTGVTFENNKYYKSRIHYKGIRVNLGSFGKDIDASNAYQKALSKIKSGTFNPNDYKANYTSKHIGVSFHKYSGRWRVLKRLNGKQKHLGYFSTELEAIKAVEAYNENVQAQLKNNT